MLHVPELICHSNQATYYNNMFYLWQLVLQVVFCGKVSEWLLFNANSAIFQLYIGENRLIFNEMMVRSALY
jgi:hypothetical protein